MRTFFWEYTGTDDGDEGVEDTAISYTEGEDATVEVEDVDGNRVKCVVSITTDDESDMQDFQRAMLDEGFHGFRTGYH